MTLYTVSTDTKTTFACTGDCVNECPPVSGTAKPGTGLASHDFGTATRPDGTTQITDDGHPLYEFAGDKTAMGTTGNGVKDDGRTGISRCPTRRLLPPRHRHHPRLRRQTAVAGATGTEASRVPEAVR